MRCYICDFSDNGQQSDFHAGLSDSSKSDKNKVRQVEEQYICDFCVSSSSTSVRESRRLAEPLDPKNYRWDVDKLLEEFRHDCPKLFVALGVDNSNMSIDTIETAS